MSNEKLRLVIEFQGTFTEASKWADHVAAVVGLEGKAKYSFGKGEQGVDGIYVRGRLDQGVSMQDAIQSLFSAFRCAQFSVVSQTRLSPKPKDKLFWRIEI